MRCEPDPDPLAIHTFVEAGEEIAYGDPSVTDAQRAAAGRETLGERSRAPLKANRRRAAQHAASTLPDDQQLVRVWQPRDPEALRVRLGNTPLAAWAEDDILHVLWRGQADEVHLAAGIQPQLWPVQGAKDLWEASVRIRRLAEAVITIAVLPRRADDDQGSQISDKLVRRRATSTRPPANRRLPCRRDHRTCAGQRRAWRTARRDRLPPARAADAAARVCPGRRRRRTQLRRHPAWPRRPRSGTGDGTTAA